MRLAIISDVHGNRPALEAVTEDIRRIAPDAIVNLGDHLSGPIDPAGTADLLIELGALTIRGNHDRVLADDAVSSMGPVDRFADAALTAQHRNWLRSLPPTAVWAETVFLCHGTPVDDETFWLDAYWDRRATTLPNKDQVALPIEGLDFPMFLCGHTHLARSVRLPDGRRIVNPGSVGLQIVHGSPDARYAVLEQRGGAWTISLRAVPYDCEAAARAAERNGFEPWGEALRTGWRDPDGLF